MSAPRGTASPPVAADVLLLLVRLGEQRFVMPAAPIARILPMAAPTPLLAAAPGVIGGLVIAGALLPIVDPRPALGVPTVAPGAAQHLLLLDTARPFLLWIDRAETIVRAPVQGGDTGEQPALVRLGEDYLTLLDPLAFAPDTAARGGWEGRG